MVGRGQNEEKESQNILGEYSAWEKIDIWNSLLCLWNHIRIPDYGYIFIFLNGCILSCNLTKLI